MAWFKKKFKEISTEIKNLWTIDEKMIIKEIAKSSEIWNDEQMEFANSTGTLNGSHDSMRARIEHVISLHLMWISVKSILQQVNKLAPIKWWWVYTSEASIKTVISAHFKNYNNPVAWDLDDHLEWLKQSMFAQQEHILEKASLHINDKEKKWTPFEYMAALKELYAMRQQLIENKNWNDSKKNINANVTNVTNQLNVFVDNSRRIALWQVTSTALTSLKDRLEQKFKEKNLD